MALFNDTDGNFNAFQYFYQLCDDSPLKSQEHVTELCVQVYQRHRGRQNMMYLSMYKQKR